MGKQSYSFGSQYIFQQAPKAPLLFREFGSPVPDSFSHKLDSHNEGT
jgi:hypothetical protein